MVKWEDELRKYIAKKLSDNFGYEVDVDTLGDLELNDVDIDDVATSDLIVVYSFALMSEDFEKAKEIEARINKDGYNIRIVTTDKTAVIEMYDPCDETLVYEKVYMIITDDGMIMDFERQKF